MSVQSKRELEATREKLRLLEQGYEANKVEQGGDQHVRELSMRSLKQLINHGGSKGDLVTGGFSLSLTLTKRHKKGQACLVRSPGHSGNWRGDA